VQFGFSNRFLTKMCIATPVKIKKVEGKRAFIADGREVDISLVQNAKTGDWLLCHANLAINKVEENEAKEILKLNKMCAHQGV